MATDRTPQPEFEGECALAVSLGKRGAMGSPDCTLVDGGKTYVFKNRVARGLWRILPNREAKAAEAWRQSTAN